jgi:hypothetical protein
MKAFKEPCVALSALLYCASQSVDEVWMNLGRQKFSKSEKLSLQWNRWS